MGPRRRSFGGCGEGCGAGLGAWRQSPQRASASEANGHKVDAESDGRGIAAEAKEQEQQERSSDCDGSTGTPDTAGVSPRPCGPGSDIATPDTGPARRGEDHGLFAQTPDGSPWPGSGTPIQSETPVRCMQVLKSKAVALQAELHSDVLRDEVRAQEERLAQVQEEACVREACLVAEKAKAADAFEAQLASEREATELLREQLSTIRSELELVRREAAMVPELRVREAALLSSVGSYEQAQAKAAAQVSSAELARDNATRQLEELGENISCAEAMRAEAQHAEACASILLVQSEKSASDAQLEVQDLRRSVSRAEARESELAAAAESRARQDTSHRGFSTLLRCCSAPSSGVPQRVHQISASR